MRMSKILIPIFLLLLSGTIGVGIIQAEETLTRFPVTDLRGADRIGNSSDKTSEGVPEPENSSAGMEVKQAKTPITIKTKSSPPKVSPNDEAEGDSTAPVADENSKETKKVWLPANFRLRITELHNTHAAVMQNSNSISPDERKKLLDDLRAKRDALEKDVEVSRESIRENAKTLREQFRATKIEREEVARRVAAHAKGLHMVTRYEAAIGRLAHIINRLESRTKKMEEEGYDTSEVVPVIEEAKNMLVESRIMLKELEAMYEELLVSDHPQETAREAEDTAAKLREQLSQIKKSIVTPSGKVIIRDIKKPV